MATPKHLLLIQAQAQGAQIQFRVSPDHPWRNVHRPSWDNGNEYRVLVPTNGEWYAVSYIKDIGTNAYFLAQYWSATNVFTLDQRVPIPAQLVHVLGTVTITPF